jgi:hypothetical protein
VFLRTFGGQRPPTLRGFAFFLSNLHYLESGKIGLT